MFWAAEPFDVRDGNHIHALIHTDSSKETLRKWMKERYGRTQVLDYDPTKGAHSYCAKYITKDLSDYDIIFKNQDGNDRMYCM
jgi:hypothetical protein